MIAVCKDENDMLLAKKVLLMAPAASTIENFNIDNIGILQNMGCEVHVATNFEFGSSSTSKKINKFKTALIEQGMFVHHISFVRRSLIKNFSAIKQYRKLLERENYTIIHCQTETGGLITRLATPKNYNRNTKIIYTPHGFNFYKGAPLKCWLVYYPIEKWISCYMDIMVSINREDYKLAKKMFAKKNKYIPGIGLKTQKFMEVVVDKVSKRKELGVPYTAIMLLSVGELCEWKNHKTVIQAIAKLNNPYLYYVICGCGTLESYLKDLSKRLGVEKQVIFAGFRNDISEICKVADIFVFPSKLEGLGVAALEAMAAGLPLITSNVHGIVDYAVNGKNAYTCDPTDADGFAKAIEKLAGDSSLREQMGNENSIKVKTFDIAGVHAEMERIYREALEGE